MESKVRDLLDASLVLQAVGSAALTADGTSTLVDINRITHSVRGALDGKYGQRSFKVVLHIVAVDHTTGDETYVVNFNTYDSAGANAFTQDSKTYTIADIGKTFVYEFDCDTLAVWDTDAAQFGAAVDVSGTTPIFQYWAFVAPNHGS